MKKLLFVLAVAGCLFTLSGPLSPAQAEVNVNIGVNVPPPPKYVFVKPPEVYVVPNYTYFVPDIDIDIFFFRNYWYRPHGGYWYRSTSYNGPWAYIVKEKVPVEIINMPPNYKRVPPGHQRIPYGQLKKNWRTWEKDKHWDKKHDDTGKRQGEKERHGWDDDRGGTNGKGEKHEYKEKSKGGGKGKH
ncbi:MAG: hypothetical protein OHK006_23820 [Thermodesulfovibrionales bacterium]